MPCSEECCDDGPCDGVLDLELGSEDRSVSIRGGGCGDLDGRDFCDGDREGGNEESDVRRLPPSWEPLC